MTSINREFLRNMRIVRSTQLTTPRKLHQELQVPEAVVKHTKDGRKTIENIFAGEDTRFLAIVGPCSIHNKEGAIEYATRIKDLSSKVKDKIVIVMRTYFEKPRTTIGWKGSINDPLLDGSFDMDKGYRQARELLIEINSLGVHCGTEFLETVTPQYLDDLVTWAAIGARTVESASHRQMASGLSMPVGFKNGTGGGVGIACDAIIAALHPHSFSGIDEDGRHAVLETVGNPYGHLILRGGNGAPNYKKEDVDGAVSILQKKLESEPSASQAILVDCSHANSGKKHEHQAFVWNDVLEQRQAGNFYIAGAMLESYLKEGNQKINKNVAYDVSVTDACIGWQETEKLIMDAYHTL